MDRMRISSQNAGDLNLAMALRSDPPPLMQVNCSTMYKSIAVLLRHRTLSVGLLLCLAVFQVHCGGQSKIHPTPENIPDATDESLVIDLSSPDQWEEGPMLPDTTGFETNLYGRDDGEEHELLVFVQDVAHDGHGTIFILDADPRSNRSTNLRKVYMVDKEGQYLGSLGSEGEGPGEFMHPRKLIVAEQGNALLVLGEERHIDVFRRNDSGSFSYSERIGMPTAVSEACMMRNHLYYLRYDADSGNVIHKYTLDGQHITGFGDPYKSSNRYTVRQLSGRGHIVCNQQQGVLGYVRSFVPVLTGFDENGVLLWRIKVDGINPMTEVEEYVAPNGAPGMRYNYAGRFEEGRGQLLPSVAFGDDNLYLTVVVSIGNEQFRSLLFQVDARTGVWQHVGRGMMPTVAEEDLLVRTPSNSAEVIQLRIRSRSD